RFAPFRYTAPTGGPLAAVARFGPDGLEGRLEAGPFGGAADALLTASGGRNLAVRLGPDGTFRAGPADVLPPGQFLSAAVLSDRQQRRQDLYRDLLKERGKKRGRDRTLLLAWADPIDMHFALAPQPRTVGTALLVLPLRLERSAPGTRVSVPGPLVECRRVVRGARTRVLRDGHEGVQMHLRFQVPAEVLPLEVERARLIARVHAPSRRVTVPGPPGGDAVELYSAESPLDPVRLDITEQRLLRLDEEGGLHLGVAVSAPRTAAGGGRGGAAQEEE